MRYRLKSVLSFNYQAVRARNRHCVGVQSEALYIALRWSSKRSFVHCIALEFKAKLCVGVQSEALYIALRWNSKRSFALEFKAKLCTLHCVGIQSEALRWSSKRSFIHCIALEFKAKLCANKQSFALNSNSNQPVKISLTVYYITLISWY
jgi:hypothetical protein